MDWTFTLTWLGATFGIIGLIYLVFFVAGKKLVRKGRDLEIIEALQLGNRQGIYLVRVKNRILVIGITNNGMQVLSQFDEASSDFNQELLKASEPKRKKVVEGDAKNT